MSASLVELLELEQLDNNLFRGQNFPAVWGTVFGGQVLAQSINAARRTVEEERTLHSMHAYFILPGKLDVPIIFHVDRIRDGNSFTTRRVVAVQKGRPIFNMSCSFQKKENGFEHSATVPDVPHHSTLITDLQWVDENKDKVPSGLKAFLANRHFQFKPTEHINPFEKKNHKPIRSLWMKCNEQLPESTSIHKEALAFASDFHLMMTGMLPHGEHYNFGEIQTASLDHAMWFHHEFKADEWLLYTMTSPSASNARGLNFGQFFNEEGLLVASVSQEGLMRNR